MNYNYFEIIKYKSISKRLRIDLKNKIIPIIGVNECGKTTILKAIFAFDYFNDNLNNGQHLQDVINLYNPYDEEPAVIEAEIDLNKEEFKDIVQNLQDKMKAENKKTLSEDGYRKILEKCPGKIKIQRILNGKKIYKIINDSFTNEDAVFVNEIAEGVIAQLPHIIYFDDFNDSMPTVIKVSLLKENPLTGWAEIVNNLFQKTHSDLSIIKLVDMTENVRKSVIADVEKKLEETITHKWTGMKLDGESSANLGFSIIYNYKEAEKLIELEIKVKERSQNNERFFNINQRSKGFYWFFNFVMKTSFNPKSEVRDDGKVIFLLDEPGAYLHVSAQTELCKKLSKDIAPDHNIIYCTHLHHLLDPKYVPLPSIRICGKEENGNVKLFTIYEYASLNTCKIHALEPIYNALGINENFLEGIKTKVVLTEGITDFYSFDMFKDDSISFMPFTTAKNINYAVPIFLSAGRNFLCLWDGDDEGKKAKEELEEVFGKEISGISFTLTDIDPSVKEIEDLYDEQECKDLSAQLSYNGSKKKLIAKIFFHPDKEELLKSMPKTRKRFEKILQDLLTKLT